MTLGFAPLWWLMLALIPLAVAFAFRPGQPIRQCRGASVPLPGQCRGTASVPLPARVGSLTLSSSARLSELEGIALQVWQLREDGIELHASVIRSLEAEM